MWRPRYIGLCFIYAINRSIQYNESAHQKNYLIRPLNHVYLATRLISAQRNFMNGQCHYDASCKWRAWRHPAVWVSWPRSTGAAPDLVIRSRGRVMLGIPIPLTRQKCVTYCDWDFPDSCCKAITHYEWWAGFSINSIYAVEIPSCCQCHGIGELDTRVIWDVKWIL